MFQLIFRGFLLLEFKGEYFNYKRYKYHLAKLSFPGPPPGDLSRLLVITKDDLLVTLPWN